MLKFNWLHILIRYLLSYVFLTENGHFSKTSFTFASINLIENFIGLVKYNG
jgi:hypothetical protein